ncbi:hypothetical protein ACWGDX_13335 [Streptomyces sp. NPDC055025]
MYELRYDPIIEAVWDSLLESAREEFDQAILTVCEDPFEATEPYGIDDGVTRMLALAHTFAVLLITQAPSKTVRILQISHLG